MSEIHKHLRDEQFWYTAAVVSFNTVVMKKGAIALPTWLLFIVSAIISFFGLHLILTRWVRNAIDGGRITAPRPDNKTATARERAGYTWWEFRAYVRDFGFIVTEFSGTLFYVLLIIATFLGVLLRCWN